MEGRVKNNLGKSFSSKYISNQGEMNEIAIRPENIKSITSYVFDNDNKKYLENNL